MYSGVALQGAIAPQSHTGVNILTLQLFHNELLALHLPLTTCCRGVVSCLLSCWTSTPACLMHSSEAHWTRQPPPIQAHLQALQTTPCPLLQLLQPLLMRQTRSELALESALVVGWVLQEAFLQTAPARPAT